jgi:phosphoglycerate dehydrogenase-like enzyme
VAFLQDVEGVIIGTEQKDKLKFQQLSNLKIVTKYGMGLDNLDLESIEEMVITGWVYWWSE